MPEISRFLGIVIRMFYLDHAPPHFHVDYAEFQGRIRIEPISLLTGNLPPRVLALVVEWATMHKVELLDNWHRLQADRPPQKIAPLE